LAVPTVTEEEFDLRITVWNYLTLDGVMQGPGHPEEDTRDGFTQGGWAGPYMDEVMAAEAAKGMAQGEGGAMIFGRRTYEKMESAWRNGPADSPFTKVMNEREKYVASRTLDDPLDWQNSTLLKGDAVETVARLREQSAANAVILGSGELIQSLLPHSLIDAFSLAIFPLTLGAGRRLFPDGGVPSNFELVDVKPTTTGVLLATYQPR
jgi:dihydrofolate reductase